MSHPVYDDSIVIDLVSPLLDPEQDDISDYFRMYRQGGVTVVGPTVAIDHDFDETLRLFTRMYEFIHRDRENLMVIRTVEDFRIAKQAGKLGLLMHFQNSIPIGLKTERLGILHALGLRVVQLTYNRRNPVGDGCTVPEDGGLTDFGRRMIAALNDHGIVVDLSHTSHRTTLEAIEATRKPPIFSHSNVYDVLPNARAIKRDQIRAVAAKGGTVGLVGCEYFVSRERGATVDDLVRHADFIAEEVGTDHISLGIDHYWGHAPHATMEAQQAMYHHQVSSGTWDPKTWPTPPLKHIAGLETPETTHTIAEALARAKYKDEDIRKILGENLIRVFAANWI
ncbi:dipeptidase [Chelativorans alearense]|uniref:dipeptidase n=1 Tax=Chelativorans alearense TaxID=2681495 RepID=UPI0013D1D5D3|nr:membrane dipeptidase [Chelativorans alearense]